MPYQKVLETDMDRVIRLSNFPTIIIVQDISRALTNRQARYRAGVAVTVLENGHVRGGYHHGLLSNTVQVQFYIREEKKLKKNLSITPRGKMLEIRTKCPLPCL